MQSRNQDRPSQDPGESAGMLARLRVEVYDVGFVVSSLVGCGHTYSIPSSTRQGQLSRSIRNCSRPTAREETPSSAYSVTHVSDRLAEKAIPSREGAPSIALAPIFSSTVDSGQAHFTRLEPINLGATARNDRNPGEISTYHRGSEECREARLRISSDEVDISLLGVRKHDTQERSTNFDDTGATDHEIDVFLVRLSNHALHRC